MSPEGEAPHPQGAEGFAVAGDSVAEMSPEDQEAVEGLARAFPGSKIGEPEPNGEAKTCPNCGRFEHFEEGHEKCAQCEVGDLLEEEPASTSTWMPVDLVPVLSGERVEPPPSILERSDGQALLYRGRPTCWWANPKRARVGLRCLPLLSA